MNLGGMTHAPEDAVSAIERAASGLRSAAYMIEDAVSEVEALVGNVEAKEKETVRDEFGFVKWAGDFDPDAEYRRQREVAA